MVYSKCIATPKDFKRKSRGKLSYEWKDHGIVLEVPRKCSAIFNLKMVSSKKFVLPKKTIQLSPLYLVESEGDTSRGPLVIELQHFAKGTLDDQQQGLRFAVCKMDDAKPSHPHTFELCEGLFNVDHYGRMELENFSACGMAIVQLDSAIGLSPMFVSCLYYQMLSHSKYIINYIVVPLQKAWKKVK